MQYKFRYFSLRVSASHHVMRLLMRFIVHHHMWTSLVEGDSIIFVGNVTNILLRHKHNSFPVRLMLLFISINQNSNLGTPKTSK